MVACREGPGTLADVAVVVLHLLHVLANLQVSQAQMYANTYGVTCVRWTRGSIEVEERLIAPNLGDVNVRVGLLQALLELIAQAGLNDGLH
jgi:hypothetical protein